MTTLLRPVDEQKHRAIRLIAAGAAAVTAGLYLLIGFGFLPVGEASSGETTDLFAFGVVLGTVFVVTAILLARFASRPIWLAAAILQVIVIIGYFAMSNLRVPAVEVNGLLVKLAQTVVLVSVGWLLLSSSTAQAPTADIRH